MVKEGLEPDFITTQSPYLSFLDLLDVVPDENNAVKPSVVLDRFFA